MPKQDDHLSPMDQEEIRQLNEPEYRWWDGSVGTVDGHRFRRLPRWFRAIFLLDWWLLLIGAVIGLLIFMLT